MSGHSAGAGDLDAHIVFYGVTTYNVVYHKLSLAAVS